MVKRKSVVIWQAATIIAICIVIVYITSLSYHSTAHPIMKSQNLLVSELNNMNKLIGQLQFGFPGDEPEIIKSRNLIFSELNKMRKLLGQLQCEATKNGRVNEQGGWCKSASYENSGEHVTDQALVTKLSDFLKQKVVASFGDGPGAYKRELLKLGQIKSYDAFDGAPYCEEVTNGSVKFMDLTIPQYGLPLYDWIISLEVAEHIPEKYESIYLDNIFRHANEGIILSWAVPGQGGLAHVNNKPLEYVVNVMKSNGFHWDKPSTIELQAAASRSWIKRNINVFIIHKLNHINSERMLNWNL